MRRGVFEPLLCRFRNDDFSTLVFDEGNTCGAFGFSCGRSLGLAEILELGALRKLNECAGEVSARLQRHVGRIHLDCLVDHGYLGLNHRRFVRGGYGEALL